MSDKTKQYHKEYSCQECNKLMFKGILIDSEVEVKCKRCGKMNTYKGEAKETYICMIGNCSNRVSIDV